MHTELLQTFVVVVRTGSMTAAALELGVVQSTVSGHLRSLERQFGVKLLDRHPHGVSPTEAGRRLAQDLLDTQARMLSEVVSRDPHPSGRVGVAAPESLCAYRLAALIPALRSVAPDVSLRFSPATTGVALDAVRAGTVEIALVMEAELAATDVRVERLGGEDLACLAAPGMAAELGPSLSWQTLAAAATQTRPPPGSWRLANLLHGALTSAASRPPSTVRSPASDGPSSRVWRPSVNSPPVPWWNWTLPSPRCRRSMW